MLVVVVDYWSDVCSCYCQLSAGVVLDLVNWFSGAQRCVGREDAGRRVVDEDTDGDTYTKMDNHIGDTTTFQSVTSAVSVSTTF